MPFPPTPLLLYGANGYTGMLIAKLASAYGIRPLIAGRTLINLQPLADELDLPYRVIDLDDSNELKKVLAEVKVVLHCAGPFTSTARQMVEACLETGVHYLDINGDISVFEMLKKYDGFAKEKNIMIMPGVGFDVVPTDCIAMQLKNKMPAASHLKLAFASPNGSISHGTAITMTQKIGEGGAVRENGRIIKKPLGHKGMWLNFVERKLFVMCIPWGDISTAYFTTGIPNIETYTGIAPKVYRLLKFQRTFNWLLRTGLVRNIIRKKIKSRPAGPDDAQRQKSKSLVWGEVTDENGNSIQTVISCPDGYTLTAHSSLLIVGKLLKDHFKPGYQTPASVYGQEFIMEVPGTKILM